MKNHVLLLLSSLLLSGPLSHAVKLVEFATGFDQPVAILDDPLGGTRKFVVEKGGTVRIVDGSTGAIQGTFLNLSGVVSTTVNEGGLLGMAFHPDYSTNRYLFVDYTAYVDNNLTSVIRRLRVRARNPNRVSVGNSSKQEVLSFQQPYQNHNGGQLVFGPIDKCLYIASGDGGSGYDPQKNGQNRKVLLGKILRMDVWTDDSVNQAGYSIPADNPYAGNAKGFREEIWHFGLRNPWRFTFDRLTGDMIIGDVGQASFEEVDFAKHNRSAINFGWSLKEGFACLNATNCIRKTRDPILAYNRSVGNSVTGGYLYRGTAIPSLAGKGAYIFADFAKGTIFSARKGSNNRWTMSQLLDTDLQISSFGERNDGELYVVSFAKNGNGKVFSLVA